MVNLLINSSDMDDLIFAEQKLKMNIGQIRRIKQKHYLKGGRQLCDKDPRLDPTLREIEMSHLILFHAHFRPYVKLTQQYLIGRNVSGQLNWNGTVEMDITSAGDLVSDMAAVMTLSEATISAGIVPTPADPVVENLTGSPPTFSLITERYCTSAGVTLTPGAAISDYIRYARYPGCRAYKKTVLLLNQSTAEEYENKSLIIHENLRVSQSKKNAWNRMVGEEIPITAISDLKTFTGIGGATDTSRRQVKILNGLQTGKPSQPVVTFITPLLHFFCRQKNTPMPVVSIGQNLRRIKMDLVPSNYMVYKTYGNLFKETVTITANKSDPSGFMTSCSVVIDKRPAYASGSPVITYPVINKLELYINNIYTIADIHKIYVNKMILQLFRHKKIQVETITKARERRPFALLKHPTEYIALAVQPDTYITDADLWCEFDHCTTQNSDVVATSKVPLDHTDFTSTTPICTSTDLVDRYTYYKKQSLVDFITVEVLSTKWWDELPWNFITDYIPYQYGHSDKFVGPDKNIGILMFCFYPELYQPSGHLNLSRLAGEFYMTFVCSLIPATVTSATVYAEATAINFIFYHGGNLNIRFTG